MIDIIRRSCLAGLLLLAGNLCQAQFPPPLNADSLRRLIAAEKVDTTRANNLVWLSQTLLFTDSVAARQAAEQALALYTRHKYKPGIAKAYFTIGRGYQLRQQLDADSVAEAQYQKGLAVIKDDTSLAAASIRARLTGNLSKIYGDRGQAEKELEMILSIIPMLERIKDTLALGVSNFNVGVKFFNSDQFRKSYQYLKKGIFFHERRPSVQLTQAYIVTAYCTMSMDSLHLVQQYLDKAALSIGSANPQLQAEYQIAMGLFHSKKKEYPQAEKAYLRAEQLLRTDRTTNRANALEGLSDVYQAQGRYAAAKKVMTEYLALARAIPWQNNILNGLKTLSGLEEKTNNHAASLRYLREYMQLNDSIRLDESQVRLHNLEMKYQASQKEKKILALENNSKHQQLVLQRSQTYNTLLLAGMIVAALVALLVFIIYRNKHRMAAQRELLHRQELENIKQTQRLQHLSAMMEGQEQERRRLARDLHDGLGGAIASIRLKAADLADSAAGNNPQLEHIITQLDNATHELRRIAHNMMPETLLKFGLEAALKDLCNSARHNGAAIVCQVFDLRPDMPQSLQVQVYRLVQELLGNALKHSGARNILVQCLQRGQELSVTVEDDGKGFSMEALPADNGIGLQSVRARVDYLKGRLDIQSTPGTGTTVTIDIDIDAHVQQTLPGIAAHY